LLYLFFFLIYFSLLISLSLPFCYPYLFFFLFLSFLPLPFFSPLPFPFHSFPQCHLSLSRTARDDDPQGGRGITVRGGLWAMVQDGLWKVAALARGQETTNERVGGRLFSYSFIFPTSFFHSFLFLLLPFFFSFIPSSYCSYLPYPHCHLSHSFP
jgi:hypothetical protein